MMVEWLPEPDPQGGKLSPGRAGWLPVGEAQHQQAGLLLLCPVPHDNPLARVKKVLKKNKDFKLYYSSNQTEALIEFNQIFKYTYFQLTITDITTTFVSKYI